ncbi:MAG: hypothetical protein KKE29_19960 [Proteobacteria bacterium]|nr:hypothetical protein [Pseudomonadota bacterium]MBV1715966.1 hypothetical protein [Desulfarculus sp.]
MTNATLSRVGVIDTTTDGSWAQDNALFLKVFAGEVLTAFDETNVMLPLHRVRQITSGKSAQFPVMWKADAHYHVPGEPILGNSQIKHGEKTINIDDLLIADAVIYSLDELKNHYEVRAEYSKQLGAALARTMDKNTLQVALLAARASANVTGGFGGTQITNASAKTDGEVLAGLIFQAAQTFDEQDIPATDRHCVLKPAQYSLLAQTTKLLNKDWGGAGVYADGSIYRVAGIPLTKSNNLPSSLISATTGANNTYNGDFSNTAAAVFHRDAIGTVKLQNLVTEMTSGDFAVMYQATLLVAKMAVGHGILRPECAVEIATA